MSLLDELNAKRRVVAVRSGTQGNVLYADEICHRGTCTRPPDHEGPHSEFGDGMPDCVPPHPPEPDPAEALLAEAQEQTDLALDQVAVLNRTCLALRAQLASEAELQALAPLALPPEVSPEALADLVAALQRARERTGDELEEWVGVPARQSRGAGPCPGGADDAEREMSGPEHDWDGGYCWRCEALEPGEARIPPIAHLPATILDPLLAILRLYPR